MKDKMLIVGKDLFQKEESYELLRKTYELIIAEDSFEAIKILTTQNCFVKQILVSLVLPRIDGYQVLNYLKKNTKPSETRVVVMVGEETYQVHLHEFAGLVDQTVRKPETEKDIFEMMETLTLAC